MEPADLLLSTLFVVTTLVASTVHVAFRSVPRFRMLDWAGSAIDGEADDGGDEPSAGEEVERAGVTIGLARQLALGGMTIVIVYLTVSSVVSLPLVWAFVTVTVAHLVFDRLIPHAIVALAGPLAVLRLGSPYLVVTRALLGPVAGMLHRWMRNARDRLREENGEARAGDLETFLDLAEEEGLVGGHEEELLRGVAHFGDTVVREVMTPRVDIISIGASGSLRDLQGLVAEHRYSRVPVIESSIDDVVGVVHIKDLVAMLESDGGTSGPVTAISRTALYVPETKNVRDLLREFQERQEQLVIVVDEYGGTAGLVTLEDLLEEIVGEIQDEHESVEKLVEYSGGTVIASGKAEVDEIGEIFDVDFDGAEFETVGGLVFSILGHVPDAGEVLNYERLRIEVLDADERRVQQVRITRE